MSYLLTWGSHTHSPATAMMAYSMAYSKHKHGECRRREQCRIGILIRLIKNSRISIPFISPTCSRISERCPINTGSVPLSGWMALCFLFFIGLLHSMLLDIITIYSGYSYCGPVRANLFKTNISHSQPSIGFDLYFHIYFYFYA